MVTTFSTEALQLRGMWGEPRDRSEAIAVIRRAVELGAEAIEVVPRPGPVTMEDLVREALEAFPIEKRPPVRGAPGTSKDRVKASSVEELERVWPGGPIPPSAEPG